MTLRKMIVLLCGILIEAMLVFCDDVNKILQIGQAEYGRIDKDGELNYFQVTIPDGVDKNSKDMVVRVRESDKVDKEKELFSDPDIYLSQTNKNPSSPFSSQYYSEMYGEDMIAISSKYIYSQQVFYIGVYCQYTCNYMLTVTLVDDIEVFDGIVYSFTLDEKAAITYKLKTRKNYEELQLISGSPTKGQYRMLVSDQSPTTENAYPGIPSWFGGVTVDITRNSRYYCSDCVLYILFESIMGNAEIKFIARYPDTITEAKSSDPLESTLRPDMSHCYSFLIGRDNYNETLIIQTTLFSGSAVLQIEGWNKKERISYSNLTWTAWTFEIHSEKILSLSPEDREEFSKAPTGENYFYFCVTSEEFTSYSIKVYFESHTEELQKYNMLALGKTITGYLPAGQATKYRVLEFSRNSDISLSLEVRLGDPILYGYLCEQIMQCHFTADKVNEEKSAGHLILPVDTGIGYSVEVPDMNNTCHEKYRKSWSNLDELRYFPCATLAVVKCEGKIDCTYRLRAWSDKHPIHLSPRSAYYQMISYNDTDSYWFFIDNDQVKNIAVVLNSITGDANLYVYNYYTKALLGKSMNDAYLPDLVKLKNDRSSQGKSLMGKYLIHVNATSFATYSLYYYTYDDDNNQLPDYSDVAVQLQTGHIIKDFLDNANFYKVYSYLPDLMPGSEQMDIRLTLTRTSKPCSIYVFTDMDQFAVDFTVEYDNIRGYIWRSDYNNELVIRKTDPQFTENGEYYIIVAKDINEPNSTDSNVLNYYLGITNEEVPFLLYEGIPHSATLNSEYISQQYWYTHPDISEPFSLSVNMVYGTLNVYVDFEEIVDPQSSKIAYKRENTDTMQMDIDSKTLKEKCKEANNCGIYILVTVKKDNQCRYILIAKSRAKKPEILIPSVSRPDIVDVGDFNYYIIEEHGHSNGGILYVRFTSGSGEVYVRIPNKPEHGENVQFLNITSNEYQISNYYMGKLIYLPPSAFDKCSPCQIQIGVYGSFHGILEEVEYEIMYSTEPRRINQNQQYREMIKSGEVQYFSLYFGEETESILISLSNMNGDADMFLNYGDDFPTFDNYTWSSTSIHNEFIDIGKDDSYFTSLNKTDLTGNYTLMIYGYLNTSYTLFVTTHPNKIIHVSENSPGSCTCQAEEYCYYRFNDLLWSDEVVDLELFATTDFVYGTGEVYAKLYNETDLDLMEQFPCSSDYDFSSIVSNSRNFLKIKLMKSNPRFTKNSMLLFSVKCREKSLVDLNIARMSTETFNYLDTWRENIFFLKKGDATILSYWTTEDANLHIDAFAYTGTAAFVVYMNESIYNNTKGDFEYHYTHLSTFKLDSVTRMSYFDTITTGLYKNVFFKVTPGADFGFYLRLNYELQWTKIKIGKMNSFKLTQNKFFGYFDFFEEYQDILLTLSTQNQRSDASIYVKINILQKAMGKLGDAQEKDVYDYSVPSPTNYDYKGETKNVLKSLTVKIKEIPKETVNGRFVRVLFLVQTQSDGEDEIGIMVTPSSNHYNRIEALPFKYYFSNAKDIGKDTTIFDLKKVNPKDNLLVIEISECRGTVYHKLSSKINYYNNESYTTEPEVVRSNGRAIVTLSPLPEDNYYLTIWGKEEPYAQCLVDIETTKITCEKDIEYMIWYYTLLSTSYEPSRLSPVFEYERRSDGDIVLNLPDVIRKKKEGKDENIVYQAYISPNLVDFKSMESICYLSKMNPSDEGQTSSYDPVSNSILIKGLASGRKYFINILAHNVDTGELLTFRPVEVIPGGFALKLLPVVIIAVIAVILLLIVIFIAYYFYKKYRITKKILKYEINDVRNLSTIPKTEAELKTISSQENEQKQYTTLREDSQPV